MKSSFNVIRNRLFFRFGNNGMRWKYFVVGAGLTTATSAFVYQEQKRRTFVHPAPVYCNNTSGVGKFDPSLPTFTAAEVAQHCTRDTGVWVTFEDAVFDVTEFLDQHPGGEEKLLLAAGADIGPFWNTYQQHMNEDVHELLAELRIGNLSSRAEEGVGRPSIADPYANEPSRHPALIVNSEKPFTAEPPPFILSDLFVTPTELHYKRNHFPVPSVNEQQYRLKIVDPQGEQLAEYTVDELKTKFPRTEITATLMCGGNRRNEFNKLKTVMGGRWMFGAISNATWAGVRLMDVLADAAKEDPAAALDPAKHVIFEGLDKDPLSGVNYAVSVHKQCALDPQHDVLLAYEMNGKPLTRDHGAPLRAVVPGHVGARSCKFLSKVVLSAEECQSHWQQRDYKVLNPSIDLDTPGGVPWESAIAIQSTPVVSAICSPAAGDLVKLQPDQRTVPIKGYAYSGGGRAIVRVDVSADGGDTWQSAELRPPDQERSRHWSWTQWSLNLPLDDKFRTGDASNCNWECATSEITLLVKAVDESFNVQPEKLSNIWNIRGLLNNSQHEVKFRVFTPPKTAV